MAISLTNVNEPPRRVTRSAVQKDLVGAKPEDVTKATKSPASKKSKSKKKVKFLDVSPSKENVNKNVSLASDEGIDMSFTPTLNLPASITRPQHKLEQNWTMWYSARNKKLSWSQNQINICSISTVEEFWHSYNQIKLASKLPAGHTYAVFKKGIFPDWEDKANVNGGRWMIYYEKSDRRLKLDERWMECLLLALGNHLDKCVTGVQVCVRGKQDRVEVWLGKTSNMRGVVEVGRKLKNQLACGAAKIEFSIHLEEKEGLKGPCLMI